MTFIHALARGRYAIALLLLTTAVWADDTVDYCTISVPNKRALRELTCQLMPKDKVAAEYARIGSVDTRWFHGPIELSILAVDQSCQRPKHRTIEECIKHYRDNPKEMADITKFSAEIEQRIKAEQDEVLATQIQAARKQPTRRSWEELVKEAKALEMEFLKRTPNPQLERKLETGLQYRRKLPDSEREKLSERAFLSCQALIEKVGTITELRATNALAGYPSPDGTWEVTRHFSFSSSSVKTGDAQMRMRCDLTTNDQLKCDRIKEFEFRNRTDLTATPDVSILSCPETQYSDFANAYWERKQRELADPRIGAIRGQVSEGIFSTPHEVDPGVKYSLVSATSFRHSCGLSEAGVLKCWGGNDSGQLGDGTFVGKAAPSLIDPGVVYSSVAVTPMDSTCAITTKGILKCWGNSLGRHTPNPTARGGNEHFIQVSGDCGITSTRELKCWGHQAAWLSGEVKESWSLANAEPGSKFSVVSGNSDITCAILENGTLKCFDKKHNGAKWKKTYIENKPLPVIDPSERYNRVSTGSEHVCGITRKGVLKCWGNNEYGQVGNGSLSRKVDYPTVIDPGVRYLEVSAGGNPMRPAHTCGITAEGVLKCWGANRDGQLGTGAVYSPTVPTVIDPGVSYRQVSAGIAHTCGITTAGQLKCWGRNSSGQLGFDKRNRGHQP